MKLSSRTAAFAALTTAFLLGAPAPVLAQANPVGNGGGRYVNSQSQTNRFAFSVVQLPNGSVNGHIVFHFPSGDAMVHMKVTSFMVIGRQLLLTGPVTKAVNTPRKDLVGSTGYIALRDGPGTDGHTGFSALPRFLGLLNVQQVATLLGLAGPGPNEFFPVPNEFFLPVVNGNIVIH